LGWVTVFGHIYVEANSAKKWGKGKKTKNLKTDMLRSIGKQSGESNFVLEKKKGYGGKKEGSGAVELPRNSAVRQVLNKCRL